MTTTDEHTTNKTHEYTHLQLSFSFDAYGVERVLDGLKTVAVVHPLQSDAPARRQNTVVHRTLQLLKTQADATEMGRRLRVVGQGTGGGGGGGGKRRKHGKYWLVLTWEQALRIRKIHLQQQYLRLCGSEKTRPR